MGGKERASPPDKGTIQARGAEAPGLSQSFTNGVDQFLLRHSLAIDFPKRGAAPATTAHAPRNNPAAYFLPIELSRSKASGAAAIAAALRKCLIIKLASENSGVRNNE